MSYTITDEHDNQIADGIQTPTVARQIAQRIADRTCRTLWIHDDEDGSADEVEPSIHLAISVGAPSDVSDVEGALDYDVTLTIGDREIEGGITLWPDGQGGMSPGSTPEDGWISGSLMTEIRKLSERRARAVCEALATLGEGEV